MGYSIGCRSPLERIGGMLIFICYALIADSHFTLPTLTRQNSAEWSEALVHRTFVCKTTLWFLSLSATSCLFQGHHCSS